MGIGAIPGYVALVDFHLPSLPKIKAQQGQTSTVTIAQSCVPYGTVRDTSHLTPETLTTYGFAGEMADVTGLTYLRARYYSPLEGRFMSRDTWEGDSYHPITLNKWSYAHGNPVKFTDPSGHDPWWCEYSSNPKQCEEDYWNSWNIRCPTPEPISILPVSPYTFSDIDPDKWYEVNKGPVIEAFQWVSEFLGSKANTGLNLSIGITFTFEETPIISGYRDTTGFADPWNHRIHFRGGEGDPSWDELRTIAIHEMGHFVDHFAGNALGQGWYTSTNWVSGWEEIDGDWYWTGDEGAVPSDYVINKYAYSSQPNHWFCPHGSNCFSEDFAETFTWMVYNSRGYNLADLDYRNNYNVPSPDRTDAVNKAIALLP